MDGPYRVVLFDVGGVLLSNGWDTAARRACAAEANLDWDDFQRRHALVAEAFETDAIGIDEYLQRTVFHVDRPFDRTDFIRHMENQSEPFPESLKVLDELASRPGGPLLGVLNNESRHLNDYRLATFGLRDRFTVFLSSCYLGLRKPDERIYHTALDIVGVPPPACLFIDDRDLNLECARDLGMATHRFTDASGLRDRLRDAELLP